MERPTEALGMDALLMKEVVSFIQNAVGKPSAILVPDRADATSSQPGLFKSSIVTSWHGASQDCFIS